MNSTQVIVAHEQALLDAMCQQDVAQLDRLLHEDLLFTLPTGQTITKAEDMATYRAGQLMVKHLRASQQQIQVLGSAAVVAVTLEMQGTYLGQPLAGTYRYMRVWQHAQAAWQVIAGSCVAVAS